MQKHQHPVDDLFRKGLADYEVTPSFEGRDAFLQKVKQTGGKVSPSMWSISRIGTLLIIVTGIVLITIFFRDKLPVDKTTADSRPASSVAMQHKINKIAVQPEVKTANSTLNQNLKTWNNINRIGGEPNSVTKNPGTLIAAKGKVPPNAKQIQRSETKELPQNKQAASISVKTASVQTTTIREANGIQIIPAENEGVTALVKADTLTQNRPTETLSVAANEGIAQSEIVIAQQEKSIVPDHDDQARKPDGDANVHFSKGWSLSAGAYYSPEWMFNTLNGDKFVNNMGVEGTYHFHQYSIRTGVGVSITTGSNEILIKSNPYLGTYEILDSVAFKWDEAHYNLIPTYYSKTKEVFDTVLQYNYSFIEKRYTYLQVPLILGYDFWNNPWLSMGVRGGAVMSVLLKTQNLSGTYDAGKDSIITINDVSPDRIRLNWQAVGGMTASFRLSPKISLELEPNIRYYFNSVYESYEITKKPWSVGLRSAILIKL
jgi:hypothetical protein